MKAERALAAATACAFLLTGTLSCTTTSVVHRRAPSGWQGERPVLADPAASAIDSSYEVHAHSISGQILWSAGCVSESATERVDETVEESRGDRLAGTAWLVAGALGVVATSATFAASANAAGPSTCTLPSGQDVDCANDRGTLLGAGVGLAVLSAAALAAGTSTFLQPDRSQVVDRQTTEHLTRAPDHVACGNVRDLAGAEVALLRPGLPDQRALVDETGGFVIALDDGSAPPTFEGSGSLVLVYAPVTMSSLVATPAVLATFQRLTPLASP